MVIMFVFVFGIVVGFALALTSREWLNRRETAQKARMARDDREDG